MSWNLFLDDERYPPNDGRQWVVCRTVIEAFNEIYTNGQPAYVSFDHDLGDSKYNGYEAARMMVSLDMNEFRKFPEDFSFYVHSQNPVGKQNIEGYLNGYLNQK